MRPLNKFELDNIKSLTNYSVDVALIEPTANGLKKSILDATGPVRLYLKENRIHDYDLQLQGQENKVIIDAKLVYEFSIISSSASLYRPETKQGDPRIWFKKLNQYSNANDIIGIIAFKGVLCLVNISRLNIGDLIKSKLTNPLKELLNEISRVNNISSNELLSKLRNIAARGPIPALLTADTAVGRTLEHLLGIEINSSKKPDFKGIELKSFRDKRNNRKTLFAQVPDWTNSKFKSSAEILKNFGYPDGSNFKLYCTVSTLVRNSQGLQLRIDKTFDRLLENSDKIAAGDFAIWSLETLHNRLLEKHNETFWISAQSKMVDGKEYFLYDNVEHTKKPITSQFDILLEQGKITLDHLIKKNSKGRVSEKGPLFKIAPKALSLLFPPSKTYSLI